MSNQLIPVFSGTISSETTLLCDARELHAFLKVGKRFASWITERMAEYGFVENQDYIIASQIREAKTRGGYNRKDYHLTLDTAKELAMVERNEQGRQVRRYFIECEKQLHQQAHPVCAPQPEFKLCISLCGTRVTEVQAIGPDMYVGRVDDILNGLRERGWIVIRRDRLAGRLSAIMEQCFA